MRTRRKFSPEFKARLVLDVIAGVKTAAEVCREHNLKPDLFSKWKSTFVAQAARVFESGPELDPAQARIAELERLVGRLSLELEVTKKASRLLSAPLSENGR